MLRPPILTRQNARDELGFALEELSEEMGGIRIVDVAHEPDPAAALAFDPIGPSVQQIFTPALYIVHFCATLAQPLVGWLTDPESPLQASLDPLDSIDPNALMSIVNRWIEMPCEVKRTLFSLSTEFRFWAKQYGPSDLVMTPLPNDAEVWNPFLDAEYAVIYARTIEKFPPDTFDQSILLFTSELYRTLPVFRRLASMLP